MNWHVERELWRCVDELLVRLVRHVAELRPVLPVEKDLLVGRARLHEDVAIVGGEQVGPDARQVRRYGEVLEVGARHPDVMQLGQHFEVEVRQTIAAQVRARAEEVVERVQFVLELLRVFRDLLDEEAEAREEILHRQIGRRVVVLEMAVWELLLQRINITMRNERFNDEFKQ